MFIFESSDTECSKVRRRRFLIELVKYAASLYGKKDRKRIAKFCGYNERYIANFINSRDELIDLRIERNPGYFKMRDYYNRSDLWKTKKMKT